MFGSSFFHYVLAALKYRESRRLGFFRMGRGIEARAARFRTLWQSHFSRSKKATQSWWEAGNGNIPSGDRRKLLVLGAGRLLDFDLSYFCEEQTTNKSGKPTELFFIDADALCQPIWREASRRYPGTRFAWRIMEMSGKLRDWRSVFEQRLAKQSWHEALRFLEEIAWCKVEPRQRPDNLRDVLPEVGATHILSLNLLSQIPVMWQEIVYQLLVRRFGRAYVDSREVEWVTAFLPGARVLLRDHLESLSASQAQSILIISDVEYLYYPVIRGVVQELPVDWVFPTESEVGHWIIKDAVFKSEDTQRKFSVSDCSSFDALHGVNLENEKFLQVFFPEYKSADIDSWLWGVCPQPERTRKARVEPEAVCHRVQAISFQRLASV